MLSELVRGLNGELFVGRFWVFPLRKYASGAVVRL